MATFAWEGGDHVTSLPSNLKLGFYGPTFGDTIAIGEYQESNHATNTGAENSGSIPSARYVLASGSSWTYWSGGAQGAGSGSVNTIPSGCCTLHIQFTHGSAVNTQNGRFFSYDGSDPANSSTSVSNKGFEHGDSSWADCDIEEGYISLDNQGSSDTHDFYVAVTATPLSAGAHTDVAYRIQLEYY